MADVDIESCDICGDSWHETGQCPDLMPDNGANSSMAEMTLPKTMYMYVTANNKKGVVAKSNIPAKTRFGPFECKKSTLEIDMPNHLIFKIFSKEGKTITLDSSTEECNWMCLVEAAHTNEDQNCIAFQIGTDIFFCTTKQLNPGNILKVWYAPNYARKVGRSPQPDGKTCTLLGEQVTWVDDKPVTSASSQKRKRGRPRKRSPVSSRVEDEHSTIEESRVTPETPEKDDNIHVIVYNSDDQRPKRRISIPKRFESDYTVYTVEHENAPGDTNPEDMNDVTNEVEVVVPTVSDTLFKDPQLDTSQVVLREPNIPPSLYWSEQGTHSTVYWPDPQLTPDNVTLPMSETGMHVASTPVELELPETLVESLYKHCSEDNQSAKPWKRHGPSLSDFVTDNYKRKCAFKKRSKTLEQAVSMISSKTGANVLLLIQNIESDDMIMHGTENMMSSIGTSLRNLCEGDLTEVVFKTHRGEKAKSSKPVSASSCGSKKISKGPIRADYVTDKGNRRGSFRKRRISLLRNCQKLMSITGCRLLLLVEDPDSMDMSVLGDDNFIDSQKEAILSIIKGTRLIEVKDVQGSSIPELSLHQSKRIKSPQKNHHKGQIKDDFEEDITKRTACYRRRKRGLLSAVQCLSSLTGALTLLLLESFEGKDMSVYGSPELIVPLRTKIRQLCKGKLKEVPNRPVSQQAPAEVAQPTSISLQQNGDTGEPSVKKKRHHVGKVKPVYIKEKYARRATYRKRSKTLLKMIRMIRSRTGVRALLVIEDPDKKDINLRGSREFCVALRTDLLSLCKGIMFEGGNVL